MNRSVEVKVCGLTSEADVALALDAGADFFGFIVYPKSPRALSLARAQALAALVPAGRRVIVDVESSCEDLERYREAGFDAFQIHTAIDRGAATFAAWSAIVGPERLWLAPRLAPADPFPEVVLDYADSILVDTFDKHQVGGTGKVGDWAGFTKLVNRYPATQWILAGGLAPDNVLDALASTQASRIDINSGVEQSPGVKDPVKLRRVFERLEA